MASFTQGLSRDHGATMTTTPFTDVKTSLLYSREQVINLMESHIAELELHLGARPTADDALNGALYVRWERLGMSWIGEVKGGLELAQLVGLIQPEQYQRLKHRAMAAITHLSAQVMMGGQR